MNASERLFERARHLMPWGTQTNAKRPDPALADVMPLFIERAEGCRMQDIDGRWFTDYRAALGPIILGYRHPTVEVAVRAQMEKGVLFSMAAPIEVAVAEQLVAMVPGLEQVRFMKTGHEANAAAVRLARAFTGRDHLFTCGYHGHSDWFASGEGSGVPRALDALVTRLPYGGLRAAERAFAEKGDRLAALLMVPYDWGEDVAHDFVHRMRELTRAHGALLLFDQVLTGFRLMLGGAQEYFGVIPDLSIYAKALGNGYPLSAFGGRRDVMAKLSDVMITITHGGEALSLAAADATLRVLRTEPVLDHLWRMGERLREGFDTAARALGLPFHTYGLPPAVRFRFHPEPATDLTLRQRFFRELLQRGIFPADPFLLTAAHLPADIDETVVAIRDALSVMAERG